MARVVDNPSERRREKRLPLRIPVVIQGYDDSGETWEEYATTVDTCAGGVAFAMPRAVAQGQVLHLALNMPRSLRQFDADTQSYYVYAVVRDSQPQGTANRVGVMFFGKEPPREFHRNPTARYLLPSDVAAQAAPSSPLRTAGAEADGASRLDGRRASDRFDIFVNFDLVHTDEWGTVLAEEPTVADNMSAGGARLMTSFRLHPGDLLVLREKGGSFETRARVVNSYVGTDRIRRIHVEFLDGRSPKHIVRSH
jgi:hypothetical protein